MSRLRTLVGIGLGLVVVAGAGWYLSELSSGASRQGGGRNFGQGQPTTVGLATVTKGDIPIIIKALGTVTPLATVTVKTQITGKLIEVNFTEGQSVKKDDLLAVVDPRPYEVALQQAIGTLNKDQALLQNAYVDVNRYKTLVAQNSVSRQTLDTQVALVAQYEATIISDKAAIDAAKLNLVYTRIVAPTDGRIGLRLVDQGNYVQLGDATGICVITLMQPISVLFAIPEDFLPQVRKRVREGATLDATAFDRAQKVQLGVGTLSTTDNQIDTTTGTVKLRAIFDNKDEDLFPQQFVNIRLLVDTVKDALVVPVAAIQRGQPGTFVYHVKTDSTVEIRVVDLGASDGEKVAILKGLDLGDQVVIDGTDRLRDGAKIRLPGAPGGPNPNGPNPNGPSANGPNGKPAGPAAPAGAAQTNFEAKPPGAGQHRGNGQRRSENGQQGTSNGERRGGTDRPAPTDQ